MKILVTGFEPFNGGTVNPSEQIVNRLEAPEGVTLFKKILPVEFKKSTVQLEKLFRELQPDVVLAIGQAGGRAEISVERVAINIDSVKSSNGNFKYCGYLCLQSCHVCEPVPGSSKIPAYESRVYTCAFPAGANCQ